jgi:hypothetical protein
VVETALQILEAAVAVLDSRTISLMEDEVVTVGLELPSLGTQ